MGGHLIWTLIDASSHAASAKSALEKQKDALPTVKQRESSGFPFITVTSPPSINVPLAQTVTVVICTDVESRTALPCRAWSHSTVASKVIARAWHDDCAVAALDACACAVLAPRAAIFGTVWSVKIARSVVVVGKLGLRAGVRTRAAHHTQAPAGFSRRAETVG